MDIALSPPGNGGERTCLKVKATKNDPKLNQCIQEKFFQQGLENF